MGWIASYHANVVHTRRVTVLTRHLTEMIPKNASVLDIGCGDGQLAKLLLDARPDLRIQGVDVLVRPQTQIPVCHFDGKSIPHEDGSFDAVMFIDVLHHTSNQRDLLREAFRVARQGVVIKDHLRSGLLGQPLLQFMDWVGNARHGVASPGNYFSQAEWDAVFTDLQVSPVEWRAELGLYPWWANWLFGKGLHFLATLQQAQPVPSKSVVSEPLGLQIATC
jgi:SAM-dependent methyltransferase